MNYYYYSVADPGEPLIFRPNWGPKGRKKVFETAPPTYLRVWMTPPPPLSDGLDLPLLLLWFLLPLQAQLYSY